MPEPTPFRAPMPPPPTLTLTLTTIVGTGSLLGTPVRVQSVASVPDGTRLDLLGLVPGERQPRVLAGTTVTAARTELGVVLDRTTALWVRTADGCCTANDGSSLAVRVPVTASAVLSASRVGPRTYAFSGRVGPAAGQRIALFRVAGSGRRVLTATGTVGHDGSFRVVRRFTGSGRFGFHLDVAGSPLADREHSAVRPVRVH